MRKITRFFCSGELIPLMQDCEELHHKNDFLTGALRLILSQSKKCTGGTSPEDEKLWEILRRIEENMEDLDPEYSKAIDDNFWNLI